MPGLVAHLRSRLLGGLFVVLPLLITLWILSLLFGLIDGNITPWVLAGFRWAGVPLESWLTYRVAAPAVGILLTATAIYLLGVMAADLTGRRLLALFERTILRVPLIKGLYGSARQLFDALSPAKARTFTHVVLLEYPRRGLWTVGFVTSEKSHRIRDGAGTEVDALPVFLPTTPNPTSGWLMLVPREELTVLDISIEDAIKLIVSGGIVHPGDLGTRIPGRG